MSELIAVLPRLRNASAKNAEAKNADSSSLCIVDSLILNLIPSLEKTIYLFPTQLNRATIAPGTTRRERRAPGPSAHSTNSR